MSLHRNIFSWTWDEEVEEELVENVESEPGHEVLLFIFFSLLTSKDLYSWREIDKHESFIIN